MFPKAVPGAAGTPPAAAEFEILNRINRREQEIEDLLRAAREAAAEKVRAARRSEAAILAGHREEADRESARVSAGILAEAQRTAGEIRAAGAARTAAIHAISGERIEQAAEHLLVLILPGVRQEGQGP